MKQNPTMDMDMNMLGENDIIDTPDDEEHPYISGVTGSGGEHGTANIKSMILSKLVPEDYLYDPLNAEPTLDTIRSAASKYGSSTADPLDHGQDSLQDGKHSLTTLLNAAEQDVNIHMARIKAVLAQDHKLLESYSQATDAEVQARTARLMEMQEQQSLLDSESASILTSLNENIDINSPSKMKKEKKQLTQAHVLERRLATWERALHMYIYANNDHPLLKDTNGGDFNLSGNKNNSASHSNGKKGGNRNDGNTNITMIQLLQHLCLTNNNSEQGQDEETLTTALSRAKALTQTNLEQASKLLQDAIEQTADTYQSYQIHLIAHSVAAQHTLKQTHAVNERFLIHGREALKIGHALELAEAKRRQSETAATLLRRWWMMENLAEQEGLSGTDIEVKEEVRGVINSSSCQMDPLFTRIENSLEAAKTLKSLRMVCRCRSGTASGTGATAGAGVDGDVPNQQESQDPKAMKKFNATRGLIQRTSAALEERLLNAFSQIYAQGGTYDFSSTMAAKRSGRLNWIMLREVAEALMSFDSGRSVHKKYVELVVSAKFPELFPHEEESNLNGHELMEPEGKNDTNAESKVSPQKITEEDIDGTRSKLSNLFHRVCEVCTEEFQLIAHVFSPTLPRHLQQSSISSSGKRVVKASSSSFPETFPLQVARALLQRLISDPKNGMQAQINGLLQSIDRRGDFDAGAKKLDTFVVIHEKAAGLFHLLKEAAQRMWGGKNGVGVSSSLSMGKSGTDSDNASSDNVGVDSVNAQSVSALIQFLTTQEMSLSNGQRRGYLNLELRLLHHHCCANLNRNDGKLMKPIRTKEDSVRNAIGSGGLADYRAPIMPLEQEHIRKLGFVALLNGLLKQSVLRQPLIHATDSLARARLMFGSGTEGGQGTDSTARVVSTIFSQMCNFYGPSYLYPVIDTIGKMLALNPPNTPPQLPFDESTAPHDLGVDGNFWITIERIHSAAKSFDRELWAENRTGSVRVWEILVQTRSKTSLTLGKERRIRFFQELEERGEAAILSALDALSNHIHWILVVGGEATVRSGTGNRRDGPYALSSGSILESTNSPAVKALTFCLRSQFVHVQSALTPQSLSAFWTALSRRLYDILVARLLQQYKVSTVGAVVLSRDVEALRSVSMLAGNDHLHWDTLRELLTLYMTPPDSLKTMLVGAEGDVNSGKGMFGRVGKDRSIVFMSRRVDYRYRTNQGSRKSQWATELLEELGVNDPTDGRVNIANYAAENITSM